MPGIMGDLDSLRDHLRNCHSEAKRLTGTAIALNALFVEEKARLDREDQVSRLRSVYSAVVEDLQRLREAEASARRDYSRAKLISSLVDLTATVISVTRRRPPTTSHGSLGGALAGELPLGWIMVCIGPGGLPDDVGAVSVSRLARDSCLPHAGVIDGLRDHGYLLLNEGSFAALISRLVGDIREGRLRLPVCRDSLIDIEKSGKQALSPKITPLE